MKTALAVGVCCLAAKWVADCRPASEAGEPDALDSRLPAEAVQALPTASVAKGPGQPGGPLAMPGDNSVSYNPTALFLGRPSTHARRATAKLPEFITNNMSFTEDLDDVLGGNRETKPLRGSSTIGR